MLPGKDLDNRAVRALADAAEAAARDSERVRGDIARYVAGYRALGTDVLPIWARQIETSRLQIEAAISSLTERFSGIVQRLDKATRGGRRSGDSPRRHAAPRLARSRFG